METIYPVFCIENYYTTSKTLSNSNFEMAFSRFIQSYDNSHKLGQMITTQCWSYSACSMYGGLFLKCSDTSKNGGSCPYHLQRPCADFNLPIRVFRTDFWSGWECASIQRTPFIISYKLVSREGRLFRYKGKNANQYEYINICRPPNTETNKIV